MLDHQAFLVWTRFDIYYLTNFKVEHRDPNTLSTIEINVLLFTFVPVSFLSRLKENEAKAVNISECGLDHIFHYSKVQ